MEQMPRGWMFTLGLSVAAVVAALVASQTTPETLTASPDDGYSIEEDPCFRYGRFECCYKGQ